MKRPVSITISTRLMINFLYFLLVRVKVVTRRLRGLGSVIAHVDTAIKSASGIVPF